MFQKVQIIILLLAGIALQPVKSVALGQSYDPDKQWYSSDVYDNFRDVTYWGYARLDIFDCEFGTNDAIALKLVVKTSSFITRPRPDLTEYFRSEFLKIFGSLPFRDLEEGRSQRMKKFQEENPNDDDFYDKFAAMEEARRRALYGGRAGAVYCDVSVKRKVFPVLYYARCSMSARDSLRPIPGIDEKAALGYSTPELIDKEIKNTVVSLLRQLHGEFDKMRKYSPRK